MKKGITILADHPGSGRALQPGDRVRLRYSVQLHHGDYMVRDEPLEYTMGDRQHVAGFRYGLEGLRVGGTRRFQASPHLCYRDQEVENIPKNALLIFEISHVELFGLFR
jgi:FKBP-type peptidyl-prolyl cis-trans isomerase